MTKTTQQLTSPIQYCEIAEDSVEPEIAHKKIQLDQQNCSQKA